MLRNESKRKNEHDNGVDKNECAKHLREHKDNDCRWSVLATTPRNTFMHKILDAHFIKTMEPSSNSQHSLEIV